MAALQYLYGDTQPIVAPYTAANVFFVGDLVGADGNGVLYPAEDQTWDTSEAETREDFAERFVGVVSQSKRTGDTVPYGNSAAVIRVATSGVFEADLDAATTMQIGDWVGPTKASGTALVSQTVEKVTAGNQAIGICVEAGTSLTRVKFKLISKLFPSGPSNTLESGS
jgi:hypothetical protein